MRKCYAPFGYLIIDIYGNVTACCSGGTCGVMGNVNNQTIEEIWNGEKYVNLRKSIISGEYTNCKNCTLYRINTLVAAPDVESGDNEYHDNLRKNIIEFRGDKLILESKPTHYYITLSHKCNLKCTMCWERVTIDNTELSKKALDEAQKYYKYANIISFIGGEIFVISEFIDFINNANLPNATLSITTNGTLLSDEILEKLKKFRYITFVFSIDSFVKETYEKIRVGANFENTYANLVKVCDRNKYPNFMKCVNFVIMYSNFSEIPLAIKKCNELNVNISFSQVSGDHLTDENIFKYKELLKKLGDWNNIIDEALKEAEKSPSEGVRGNIIARLNNIRNLLSE